MKSRSSAKRLAVFFLLVFFCCILGYGYMRQTNKQTWEKNGREYVIFPKDTLFLYYLYRPMAWIDGKITGMGFHIGPHEN
jgi:hypothetical protein